MKTTIAPVKFSFACAAITSCAAASRIAKSREKFSESGGSANAARSGGFAGAQVSAGSPTGSPVTEQAGLGTPLAV